ncbi:MAG: plasmid recombination protein [Clostridia bacterium]
MVQELAYSIHLGSDKNRSKVAKKVAKGNGSSTTSFSNNAIQNAQQLSKVNKHNLRDYDHKTDDIQVVYGTNDLYKDVQNLYQKEFLQAQLEYDNKQIRADRKIGDYFNHISKDSKHDLACELIIELGDMDFWNDKTMDYKKQMTEVYKDQIYKLMEVVPDFKVANAVVHYDETSPHMHLVGIPVKDGYKNGMKKQVAKSKIFTKESLKTLQDKMRAYCIEKFNEVYVQKATLKKKQKGRNKDIHVNEMEGYRELKREQEKNAKKLKEANNRSDKLNDKTEEINNILDNLKPSTFNKNNKQISNEDVEKIKNYAKEVEDTTKSIKSVNNLNVIIDNIEQNYKDLVNNRDSLYYSNNEKDTIIANLKEEIEFKNKKINKLELALDKVKTELSKFKDFWRRLIKRFQIKIMDEKFEDIPEEKRSYTIVAEDLERSGIFDDNDAEIVKNPRRKILTKEELNEIHAKKGKNKNDYNLN